MRLHEVIIEPPAELDLEEGWDFYEGRRPGLGDEFLLCVEAALGQISREPLLHRKAWKDVRKAVVHRFPYLILYFLDSEVIHVIAVLHGKRRPREWKSRR